MLQELQIKQKVIINIDTWTKPLNLQPLQIKQKVIINKDIKTK